jgi:tRNA modification GTPase
MFVVVFNKSYKLSETQKLKLTKKLTYTIVFQTTNDQRPSTFLLLSAKEKTGVETLKNQLLSFVNTGALRNNETIVTNTRHYDSLLKALEEVQKVKHGLETNLPSDLMAIDIRQALYHFGEITGQVTNDELLGNIFANFCIGK